MILVDSFDLQAQGSSVAKYWSHFLWPISTMPASASTLGELSESWDLLEASSVTSGWEFLSHCHDDDSMSVAASETSVHTLCTELGWPSLATGEIESEDRTYGAAYASVKDALLLGGGGLDGDKALEMAKGPARLHSRCQFVNGYRRRNSSLPPIDEELDADQDWWIRKGQGSLLAKRRWKNRRSLPNFNERREGFGRQEPTWEYECGQSAEGYCMPEDEEPMWITFLDVWLFDYWFGFGQRNCAAWFRLPAKYLISSNSEQLLSFPLLLALHEQANIVNRLVATWWPVDCTKLCRKSPVWRTRAGELSKKEGFTTAAGSLMARVLSNIFWCFSLFFIVVLNSGGPVCHWVWWVSRSFFSAGHLPGCLGDSHLEANRRVGNFSRLVSFFGVDWTNEATENEHIYKFRLQKRNFQFKSAACFSGLALPAIKR